MPFLTVKYQQAQAWLWPV